MCNGKGGVAMTFLLPPSGGKRSASHQRVRVTNKKMKLVVFRALFKFVEFLGMVLKVLNEARDLFEN